MSKINPKNFISTQFNKAKEKLQNKKRPGTTRAGNVFAKVFGKKTSTESVTREAKKPSPASQESNKTNEKVKEMALVAAESVKRNQPSSVSKVPAKKIQSPLKHKEENQANALLETLAYIDTLPESSGTISIYNQLYTFEKKDISEGVKTVSFFLNGIEKYQINRNAPGAYNGVKDQDFTSRADLMKSAALSFANGKKNEASFKQAINNHFEAFQEKMQGIHLDPEIMQQSNKKAKGHFNQVYSEGKQALVELYAAIQKELKQNFPDEKADLKIIEREHVANRGRPTILNIFSAQVPDEGGTLMETQLISMQTPQSENTIPSSIRDRKGLCNFVSTSFGVVEGNQAKILFAGFRHSSVPPIAEKNPQKRAAIAALNAKQAIENQARQALEGEHIKGGETEEEAISLPMSAVTLFTAKSADFVRDRSLGVFGKWKGASETRQLNETKRAYDLYNGCPVQVEIDGEKVWIKPEITHCNFGINKEAAGVGIKGGIQDSPTQELLNRKTMTKTAALMQEEFKKLEEAFPDNSDSVQIKQALFPKAYSKALAKFHEEEESVHIALNNDKKRIQEINEKLGSGASISEAELQILKNLEKKIQKQESALLAKAEKLDKNYEDYFKSIQQDLKVSFDIFCEKLNHRIAGLPEPSQTEARNALNNLIHGFEFQKSFYNLSFKNPDTVKDTPTQAIEFFEGLGHGVYFNCKSAEDRTGDENETIETHKAIEYGQKGFSSGAHLRHAVEKHYSDLRSEIHQGSASLNNTYENSNARGLQVGYTLQPKTMHAEVYSGKKMALLAKDVPAEGKKLSKKK